MKEELELLETAREIVRDEHPAFNEGEVDAVVQEWKKNPEGQRGCLISELS